VTAKPRDIVVRLTEPQYEALRSAITLVNTTFELDGPASVGMKPHVPRSLKAAEERLALAWHRAGMGF
jgi:hypothetical protein